MVETAARLMDQVFPAWPVRQWVLAVPKHLRYFMQRDEALLNMVLRIFLRVIVQSLQIHCPGAASTEKATRQRCDFPSGQWGSCRCHGLHAGYPAPSHSARLRGQALQGSFEAKDILGCKHSGF
jgi:hypothetical protein